MKHLIHLVVILLVSIHSYAQETSINWPDIESNIRRNWLIGDVQRKVLQYKEKAIREQDDITVARCFYNLMILADKKTEDTMLLRNSAYMDSIIKGNTSPTLLTALTHLMKAKRIWHFRANFYYARNKQAFSGTNDGINYALLDIGELDSITLQHFSQALNEAKGFNRAHAKRLLWLSSSPESFLFEPIVTDIIYAELAEFLNSISRTSIDRLDWLNLSQDEFINMTEPSLYFSGNNLKAHTCFKYWANTHGKKSPATFYYIESLARKHFFRQGYSDSTRTARYESYLQQLVNSPYSLVRANGVFQLCLLWNEKASKYRDDDRKNQAYIKLLDLYHSHKATLDSFALLNRLLTVMEKKIMRPEFSFAIDFYQLPGWSIPVELRSRNTGTLFYRTVRINETSKNLDSFAISQLLKLPATDSGSHDLPLESYLYWRDTTVHLRPMAAGKYAILYSDQQLKEGNYRIEYLPLHVTNIAMINNDSRIFILDRKTGQPLKGATVAIDGTGKRLQVNEHGYVNYPNKEWDKLTIYIGADTLCGWANEPDKYDPGEIYDKDEYDNLMEFYEDNVQLHIFTDRSVYRPGQTVHYKGLLLAPNPKTGKIEVLNWKNLRYPTIKKLYYRLAVKFGKKKLNIFINDSFGREIDSINVLPNSYGSFAGSFVIPKNAATGEWDFTCDEFENADENAGTFKVEEYKRPTFELVLKKPEGELYLGDPFDVKMVARSFTGASMNNVTLQYQVLLDYKKEMLSGGEAHTDDKGEYVLHINDTLRKRMMLKEKEKYASYEITVTAIDGTGENHEEFLQFNLQSAPVLINMPFPAVFEKNKLLPVFISAQTELSQPLVKTLELKLYEISDGDKLLYTTTYTTEENNKFSLPEEIISSGYYKLEANCYKENRLVGTASKSFKVFDPVNSEFPVLKDPFHHLVSRSTGKSVDINWYSGNSLGDIYSIYQVTYLVRSKSGLTEKYDYFTRTEKKGLQEWKYSLPADAVDHVLLTHLYVFDNRLYRKIERVYIPKKESENPALVIEQYRKKLVPGGKETFNVSIKTGNGNKAMELLTGMYDASLEKIEEHQWNLPRMDNRSWLNSNWNYSINSKNSKQVSEDLLIRDLPGALEGNVAGVSVINTSGLDEVVVMGYSSERRLQSTAAAVTIRGTTSLSAYSKMLIILDGVVYEKELSALNLDAITGSIILKGAEATALYGAKAAGGVLILSTKGPVQLPGEKEEVPVKIRKNFSETAFFYPQLHAGRDGLYHISFTMPESVTEWNWKMFAHDKRSTFIYEERKLVSQLPLMVQPDLPRFLYQGDQLVLKTRIINLDTNAISGLLKCTIEDAVTGEDLSQKLLSSREQQINVNPSSNSFASLRLSIPTGLLHPLVIRVSARAGNFSDGEEYTIPVLSRKVLASRQVPIAINNGTSVQVPLPVLPENAEPYAISLGISPKAQATLINALPYLAFYPYGCAEQTFNKLLAFSTARNMLRTDTGLARSWNIFKSDTTGSGAAPLPYEPEEQTMPWLQLSNSQALNQQKLKLLFDTLPAGEQVKKLLAKIMEAGNADGGVSWFQGGKSSIYISAYLLAGFGKLKQDKLLTPEKMYDDNFHSFIRSLVKYCDAQFLDTLNLIDPISYLYARTYWKPEYPMTDTLKNKADRILEATWRRAGNYPVNIEARLITVTLRYAQPGSPLFQKARLQLEAIRQMAITDEAGTRWKALSDAADLDVSKEECIAMIAEAFETAGSLPGTVDGIIKWLIRAKSNHVWGTTKATAAVANLLVKYPGHTQSAPSGINTDWNNKALQVTDNLFSGKLVDFSLVQGGSMPFEMKVNRTGTDTSSGEIMLYYFSDMREVSEATPVRISKTYLLYNAAADNWEKIDTAFKVKPGDKIQVRLSIESQRLLKYVFLDDRRAACFEPLNDESGHEYENGISYYKSIRDAGYQFFAESIPAGTSTLTYKVTVSKQGVFSTGLPSLQCMYQPGVRAYGKNVVVTVE